MKRINALSDKTIVKIAAGEIIENPASIIKELVENSIDAKANNIQIEVKNNGSELIKISDNGEGFNKDDLNIAFKRHTTSKINEIEDLNSIYSLGFRGEALSSISYVSDVTLITKQASDEIGTIVNVNSNGEIISQEDIVTTNGSSIFCRNLFDKIPVRKKYLESRNFESDKTNQVINELALSRPDISIEFIKDSRMILKTNRNTSQLNNVYSVLGGNISGNLMPISIINSNFSIKGFISNNNLYRSNRKDQYIFVNDRSIKSEEITKAIERAYMSFIPLNRYPVFILYIDIDPIYLDVNIHPKKDVIKFLNIKDITTSLYEKIREEIYSSFKIQSINIDDKIKDDNKTIFDIYQEDESESFDDSIKFTDLSNEVDSDNTYLSNKDGGEDIDFLYNKDRYSNSHLDNNQPFIAKDNVEEINIFDQNESIQKRKILPNGYSIAGTIFNQYIILEDYSDKSVYLLDQHAAHERINYELLKSDFQNNSINIQNLISGYLIEFSPSEFEIIKELKEMLDQIGFEIDEFGDNTIILRSVPAYLGNLNPEELFRNLIESNEIKENLYDINPYHVMKLACSASIKTGDRITNNEITRLIESLNECEVPYTCPHGRPTIIRIDKKEIDKEFFRIQI